MTGVTKLRLFGAVGILSGSFAGTALGQQLAPAEPAPQGDVEPAPRAAETAPGAGQTPPSATDTTPGAGETPPSATDTTPGAAAADASPAAAAPEGPAAQAAAPAEAEEEVSPLVPEGEPELMDSHTMDTFKYRPGKGLHFESEDGLFSTDIKTRAQILYTLHLDDGEEEDSMQIRRARFAMQGNAFGKHNKYKLEIAISPRDDFMREGTVGTSPLLDWYLTFDYVPEATIVVGQYKIPYNRQRVVSSGSLQFVDRSIVQGEFNLDRDIGIDLRSKALLLDAFRYYAGVYIGEGRNAFQSSPVSPHYLVRLEALPFGDFEDYSEADFERLLEPKLSIGASYSFMNDSPHTQGVLGPRPEDGGTTDFHNMEADLMFKMAGASVQSEVFVRDGDQRKSGGEIDPDTGAPFPLEETRDGWGFFAQAGYLIPHERLEVGGRYGQMNPVGDDSALTERHELGGVVSYYFAHHTWKLQADYFRLWEDNGISDGEDQIRVQMEFGL